MGKRKSSYTNLDPLLILSQIVCLQCVYYLGCAVLYFVVDRAENRSPTLHQFFSPYALSLSDATGRYNALALFVNALFMSFIFERIIERSKKCADFACTLHIVHVVACIFWNGAFPTYWGFWLVHVVNGIILCLASEYLCRKRELNTDINPRSSTRRRESRVQMV